MSGEEIYRALKERFGDDVTGWKEGSPPCIEIKKERIKEISGFLREEERLLFDYLVFITALHEKEEFKVLYCLFSYKYKHSVILKASIPVENPEIDSVSGIWPTAEWHERETYDFFGIVFRGNPDLRRILLPDDWEGYPLRKDYIPPDFYHGIDNRYRR